MKRLLSHCMVLMVVFVTGTVNGQWLPFYEDETAHYESNQEFLGLAFDSVVELSDRDVYYPKASYNCNDCEPHWIGKQIEVFPNGDHLFYNKDDEASFIRSSAELNEEWVVLERPTKKLLGKCVAIEWKEVLGVMDSVKTFEFQMVDTNDNDVGHQVNDVFFELSSKYGYLRNRYFYYFPDVSWHSASEFEELLLLAGTSKDSLGYQNIKWSCVFDFSPGDELHVLELDSEKNYYTGASSLYEYFNKYQIESKKLIGNEFVYSVHRTQFMRYTYFHEVLDSTLTTETIDWRFPVENVNFDRIASVQYQLDGEVGFNVGNETEFGPGKILHAKNYDPFGYNFDGTDVLYNYVCGAGGPYFNNRYDYSTEIRQLVYLKNAKGEFGERFDESLFDGLLNETSVHLEKAKLEIYPNPFFEHITIEMKKPMSVACVNFYSMNGKKVSELTSVDGNVIEIHPRITPGFYYCTVTFHSGESETHKLVKL